MLRKLKLLREVPRGDLQLIPGQLATLLDLRRQLFFRVEFWEDPKRNEKHNVAHWLEVIPPGSLLLFDLGFFAFPWFGCPLGVAGRRRFSFRLSPTREDDLRAAAASL